MDFDMLHPLFRFVRLPVQQVKHLEKVPVLVLALGAELRRGSSSRKRYCSSRDWRE
jgi:hypothetical protein